MKNIQQPANYIMQRALDIAFAEDWGAAGDVTSHACIAPGTQVRARLHLRGEKNSTDRAYVVAGLELAAAAIRYANSKLSVELQRQDGDVVAADTVLADISGAAGPLLGRERVALNYLCHLSAIASIVRQYVQAVSHTRVRIVDTRKTTPGLRSLEKFAVRCGGGHNHRFGLFDAMMIKDNHIAAAGGILPALRAAKQNAGHMVSIELEIDNLQQLRQIDFADSELRPNCILLDNMSPSDMRAAVQYVARRALCEASGGVTLPRVAQIAETGVDLISVGALTHSLPSVDIGLDFLTN